jgi:uncharacterized repeat protein (TIGR03803 family)
MAFQRFLCLWRRHDAILTRLIITSFIFCSLASASRSATLTTLAKFSYATGISPTAGVTLDAAGNLYGSTSDGGVLGDRGSIGEGGIFRVDFESNQLQALAWFNSWTGLIPNANLIRYSDGNLYGTAHMDGGGNGTIFRFNPSTNTITPLVAFDGTNGSTPSTGLVVGTDGAFYGTTGLGGTAGKGTLFRFDVHTNQLTNLVSFNGTNGSYPGSTLAVDENGDLYGTTSRGGTANKGTVFKFSTSTNTLSTIATFTGQNGDRPNGALTLDSSGNLFGTTVSGGQYDKGTIYRLSTVTNTLSSLVSFNGPNGAWPHAGMIMDARGNLYGTTSWGGIDFDSSEGGMGTIFRWDSTSQMLTTLAFFDGYNGKHPFGELAVGTAGNLYGTTNGGGGGFGFGTVFKVSDTGYAVPEPSSFALMMLAASSAIFIRRRTA